MEAYSLDLRERVARACDEGQETRVDTAERFGVSESFIRKLPRRRPESSSLVPRPRGGGRQPALDQQGRAWLRELVDQQPDATLKELQTWLRKQTGKTISKSAVDRHRRALDRPRKKKSLHASERQTPRVQRLRRAFQKRVRSIPAAKLVFVEESGTTTSMTRTHGRAPPGERVVDTVPLGHWTVMTMLGAVRLEGPVAVMTVEAATDAEIVRSFVDAALIPSLHQGDVVVWDNLGPHRTVGLEPMLQAVGASLLPLPPYSGRLPAGPAGVRSGVSEARGWRRRAGA